MKKSDIERLKKIVSLWEALSGEIMQRGITRELLLTEQFSQWAVTTPIYNIGEHMSGYKKGLDNGMEIVLKQLKKRYERPGD